jgi:3-deoxy-D-manno-octulosonic-acid transferase
LAPFTTLAESAAKRSRDALGDAVQEGLLPLDHGFVVNQYKEANDPDWNVLVCHPRSLKHWSFEGVSMIAIDEVTAMLSQVGAW